MPNIKSS